MNPQMSRRGFIKLLAPLLLTPLLDEREPLREKKNLLRNEASPNVLVVVFDALSARNVSLYGYDRETTPNLARFADRATVYHAHYAAGNFTPSGTSSLLTGAYPWANRAFNHSGTVVEDFGQRNLFHAFAEETYDRIAYTHNLWVSLLLNQFRQDIDIYLDPGEFCLVDDQLYDRFFPGDENIAFQGLEGFLTPSVEERPGSLFLSLVDDVRISAHRQVLTQEYASLYPRGVPELWNLFFLLEHAIDGIEALISTARKPFLGYFHLLPPHDPYSTRHEFIDLFDDGWTPEAKKPHFFSKGHSDKYLNYERRQYDEYVAYADAEFGRLYDFMAQSGMLDDTCLVVTSDHGEMFERGILGHQTQVLYEPVIRTPLLIHGPGQQNREDVYTPTSCIDLLPTLLQATGQAIPEWCEGELLPKLGGGEGDSQRSIFSVEAKSNSKWAPLTKGTVALIKGQYKLIHYFGYPGFEDEYELYDLVNDPEEMQDVFVLRKSVAADLQNELAEKLREVNQSYAD